MLARSCSKSFKLGFNSMWSKNVHIYKLDWEKVSETRDQIANIHWIIEKAREFQKNIDFCFIDYFKAFDCEDPNGLWKIVKETGISDQLTHFLQKQIKKQQLEPDMEQWTASNWGKEYIKSAYCHPAYLTNMQSTSWETLGLRKHNLESRFLGEIPITSGLQFMSP